jgi:hypothetical protein
MMGKPMEVTKTDGPPTPEQVDIVHEKYIGTSTFDTLCFRSNSTSSFLPIAEQQRIFNEHKERLGYASAELRVL